MRGTYVIETTSKSSPEYFNACAYESNKTRAIKYAERLKAQGKQSRVKIYLTGEVIS